MKCRINNMLQRWWINISLYQHLWKYNYKLRWSFQDRSSHITCFVIIPLFYTFQQSYYRNESLIISVTLMRMCALLIVEMESLKHDLYFNVHAALWLLIARTLSEILIIPEHDSLYKVSKKCFALRWQLT